MRGASPSTPPGRWVGIRNPGTYSEWMTRIQDSSCSIARSLGVLGERWTILILRDAFDGLTRFQDFRQSLGIASDILTSRLAALVEYGVMERVDYQEPGSRRRHEYRLTDAGRELLPLLAALQEWGDRHLPRAEGPSVMRYERGTHAPVRVAFVDQRGREIPSDHVDFVPTAAYPEARLQLLQDRRSA